MGRRRLARDLTVAMNGLEVGTWTRTAQGEQLSISNSFIGSCTGGQFEDTAGSADPNPLPYLVSDWYNAGTGNRSGDPKLNGYLPAADSPLLTGGASPSDAWFVPTTYVGAFAGPRDNWTQGWTENLPNQ